MLGWLGKWFLYDPPALSLDPNELPNLELFHWVDFCGNSLAAYSKDCFQPLCKSEKQSVVAKRHTIQVSP